MNLKTLRILTNVRIHDPHLQKNQKRFQDKTATNDPKGNIDSFVYQTNNHTLQKKAKDATVGGRLMTKIQKQIKIKN